MGLRLLARAGALPQPAKILDTAAEFRKRKIPVDALVQDWQYWGKYGWNAMKFDEDHYRRPKETFEQLHANDLNIMVSIWCKVWGRCSGKLWLELTNFAPNETTEILANPRGISAKWAVGETLTASKVDTATSFDAPNMVVPSLSQVRFRTINYL